MAQCETCGNDYDKTFKVVLLTCHIPSIALSAPCRRLLLPVTIVAAESSVTA
jgi:hypothetical protein